jgi:hypothetical protein
MNPRTRRARSRSACCQPLEIRRLLAVFNGTEGDDQISISSVGGTTTNAVVFTMNGTTQIFTSDAQITVNGLGGNDRIGLGSLGPGINESHFFTIDAGPGDDSIFATLPFQQEFASGDNCTILGGTGNDSFNPEGDDFTLDLAGNEYRVTGHEHNFPQSETIVYDTSIENVNVTLENGNIVLTNKPAGTHLNVETPGSSSHTFQVGGGDLDSHGFTPSTTNLVGGLGSSDVIEFHDEQDLAGEVETYAFSPFSMTKGNFGVTYSQFEREQLYVSDVVGAPPNTVNFNVMSAQIASTTVFGGANRSSVINVGNGALTQLSGTFHLDLHGGTVNLNDQADTTARALQFSASQFTGVVQVDFTGVGTMTLNAGSGNDAIAVLGTPAGMSLTINADPGNDNVSLGDGNIDADLLGPVTVNGSAGTDSLTIDNHSDATSETQTLSAFDFIDSGVSYGFSGIDGTMTVNLGSGANNLTVNALLSRTTITGGSGDDSFAVGGGDLDLCIPASAVVTDPFLVIAGQGGADSILFDDRNDASNTIGDNYQFQRTNGVDQLQRVAGIGTSTHSHFASWSGIEKVTLEASPQGSLANVVDIATPLRINARAGSDTVQIVDAQSPITVNTGLGDQDQLIVNADNDGEAVTAIMDQSDDVEVLTVRAGGTLEITSEATLLKTRIMNGSLTLTGTLDLAGGSFLVRAGGPTQAQLRNWLIAGRNGGAWTGTSPTGAIDSSLAGSTAAQDSVGYGLGSEIAPTSIGPFDLASGDTLLRYTFDGDADLNQLVNLADFNRLATNFGQTNRVWTTGDASYDGSANLTDFNALAVNFGSSVAPETLFSRNAIGASDSRRNAQSLVEELS